MRQVATSARESVLRITSRTPMGNLLMIEELLQVFQEFEQSGGMACKANSFVFFVE